MFVFYIICGVHGKNIGRQGHFSGSADKQRNCGVSADTGMSGSV